MLLADYKKVFGSKALPISLSSDNIIGPGSFGDFGLNFSFSAYVLNFQKLSSSSESESSSVLSYIPVFIVRDVDRCIFGGDISFPKNAAIPWVS